MRSSSDLHSLTVTEAYSRGIARLVEDAEHGENVVISRSGTLVAAIVGMRRLGELQELERDLRDLALVLTRAATDTGGRTALDAAIERYGYSRAEMESDARDLS
ncbi:type II toxin-antitoxin system prevent-host-death family antitoxin [Rhodococcus sp. NPDC056960]|uniref:type II toxin-antitoxin system prevent-host-death family antitoxin n=1 Tax=Rhodococcus sp. NPDC056960 TaxID=3345982 RepID=UPI00363471C3